MGVNLMLMQMMMVMTDDLSCKNIGLSQCLLYFKLFLSFILCLASVGLVFCAQGLQAYLSGYIVKFHVVFCLCSLQHLAS